MIFAEAPAVGLRLSKGLDRLSEGSGISKLEGQVFVVVMERGRLDDTTPRRDQKACGDGRGLRQADADTGCLMHVCKNHGTKMIQRNRRMCPLAAGHHGSRCSGESG